MMPSFASMTSTSLAGVVPKNIDINGTGFVASVAQAFADISTGLAEIPSGLLASALAAGPAFTSQNQSASADLASPTIGVGNTPSPEKGR